MKQAKIPRFLGALFFIYDISPSIQIQQLTHLAKRDAEPEHTRRIFFFNFEVKHFISYIFTNNETQKNDFLFYSNVDNMFKIKKRGRENMGFLKINILLKIE